MANFVKNNINYHGTKSRVRVPEKNDKKSNSDTRNSRTYQNTNHGNDAWGSTDRSSRTLDYSDVDGAWGCDDSSRKWGEESKGNASSGTARKNHKFKSKNTTTLSFSEWGENEREYSEPVPDYKPPENIWEKRTQRYESIKAMEPASETEEEKMIRMALELSKIEAEKDIQKQKQLHEEFLLQQHLLDAHPEIFSDFKTDEELTGTFATIPPDSCANNGPVEDNYDAESEIIKENTYTRSNKSDKKKSYVSKEVHDMKVSDGNQKRSTASNSESSLRSGTDIAKVVDMFGGWGSAKSRSNKTKSEQIETNTDYTYRSSSTSSKVLVSSVRSDDAKYKDVWGSKEHSKHVSDEKERNRSSTLDYWSMDNTFASSGSRNTRYPYSHSEKSNTSLNKNSNPWNSDSKSGDYSSKLSGDRNEELSAEKKISTRNDRSSRSRFSNSEEGDAFDGKSLNSWDIHTEDNNKSNDAKVNDVWKDNSTQGQEQISVDEETNSVCLAKHETDSSDNWTKSINRNFADLFSSEIATVDDLPTNAITTDVTDFSVNEDDNIPKDSDKNFTFSENYDGSKHDLLNEDNNIPELPEDSNKNFTFSENYDGSKHDLNFDKINFEEKDKIESNVNSLFKQNEIDLTFRKVSNDNSGISYSLEASSQNDDSDKIFCNLIETESLSSKSHDIGSASNGPTHINFTSGLNVMDDRTGPTSMSNEIVSDIPAPIPPPSLEVPIRDPLVPNLSNAFTPAERMGQFQPFPSPRIMVPPMTLDPMTASGIMDPFFMMTMNAQMLLSHPFFYRQMQQMEMYYKTMGMSRLAGMPAFPMTTPLGGVLPGAIPAGQHNLFSNDSNLFPNKTVPQFVPSSYPTGSIDDADFDNPLLKELLAETDNNNPDAFIPPPQMPGAFIPPPQMPDSMTTNSLRFPSGSNENLSIVSSENSSEEFSGNSTTQNKKMRQPVGLAYSKLLSSSSTKAQSKPEKIASSGWGSTVDTRGNENTDNVGLSSHSARFPAQAEPRLPASQPYPWKT